MPWGGQDPASDMDRRHAQGIGDLAGVLSPRAAKQASVYSVTSYPR